MTGGTTFMPAVTDAAWSIAAVDYDGPEDNGEFYFYRRNGYIEIREYFGDKTQAVIPKELDGLPVRKVGTEDYPFLSGGAQNRVTSIIIPDSV